MLPHETPYEFHERLRKQAVVQAPDKRPELPPEAAHWSPVADVLAVINDPRWSWVRNTPCKYIELRIDTRNQACLIYDRDKRPMTLRELSRQLDDYLLVESCEGCVHRQWIAAAPFGSSKDGWGCLWTGGHAVTRCAAFKQATP